MITEELRKSLAEYISENYIVSAQQAASQAKMLAIDL